MLDFLALSYLPSHGHILCDTQHSCYNPTTKLNRHTAAAVASHLLALPSTSFSTKEDFLRDLEISLGAYYKHQA